MGREVRKVPPDWQHPRDDKGRYVGLLEGYSKHVAQRAMEQEAWQRGKVITFGGEDPAPSDVSFDEWYGEPPNPDHYVPDFSEGSATFFQMYETVSEGTPISPPMPTLEALAKWLSEDSSNDGWRNDRNSYEQWLAVCKAGWVPSGVVIKGHFMTGVEAEIHLQARGKPN